MTTNSEINIIEAIRDERLFRNFLADANDDISSWNNWLTALKVVYGIDTDPDEDALIQECTGRDAHKLPFRGFDSILFLTGRRCGKSRVAGLMAAFEATLAGHEAKLAAGETGYVAVISPTKQQSNVVRGYIHGALQTTGLLQDTIDKQTRNEGLLLKNGIRIVTLTGDWRTVRGHTLIAAIIDEACFFGDDNEANVKSDTELITAIEPSLSTTNGKLICISSPYARRGWCYKRWEEDFGNDHGDTLVWKCPSRTMNPTLPQKVIDRAMRKDPAKARSEYLAEWRDDVGAFLSMAAVRTVVVPDRIELLPRPNIQYRAFADVSGGRHDDAALAIAHRADNGHVIVDKICLYKSPFNPQDVVKRMAYELRRFRLLTVTGDNYAAEFTSRAFSSCGIKYTKSKLNKNDLYKELLPRIGSGEIELLDNELLIDQLTSLERRTHSGGKDIIDHPRGRKDDVANAVAGVSELTSRHIRFVGAIR